MANYWLVTFEGCDGKILDRVHIKCRRAHKAADKAIRFMKTRNVYSVGEMINKTVSIKITEARG